MSTESLGKKFVIDFHKSGTLNESIAAIVSGHNEGSADLCMQDIQGFCRCFKAKFPPLAWGLHFKESIIDMTLSISEDGGKTFTMTIYEKFVVELSSSEADLLKQSHLS